MSETSRYRRAAAIYFVLGVTIMAITALTPGLASPARRADLIHMAIGLPFFALFALAIAYGDRAVAWLLRVARMAPDKAARAGCWAREKLVMLLTLSALGRTFIFAAGGLGWKPGVDWRPFALSMEAVPPMPRMLINAALMTVIFVVLARVAWLPFLCRLRGG